MNNTYEAVQNPFIRVFMQLKVEGVVLCCLKQLQIELYHIFQSL